MHHSPQQSHILPPHSHTLPHPSQRIPSEHMLQRPMPQQRRAASPCGAQPSPGSQIIPAPQKFKPPAPPPVSTAQSLDSRVLQQRIVQNARMRSAVSKQTNPEQVKIIY